MRRWKKTQKVHGCCCCGYRHGWRVSPDNYNATVGQLKRVRTTPGFRHEPDTSPAGTNGKNATPSDEGPRAPHRTRKPSPDSPRQTDHKKARYEQTGWNKSQSNYSIHVRAAADVVDERGDWKARAVLVPPLPHLPGSFVPAMCHRGGGDAIKMLGI
ncbi:hypothetical protein CEXT_32391 [Caerostris extrusa]|uniref:Uncharacterized protein n=1 Tax=Caerostris extrusa TaxID=172846 RepID=A0AAV4RT10_CAEEX|nr:hypothetical protein CEXT_32391 [Caerostris extrusa]